MAKIHSIPRWTAVGSLFTLMWCIITGIYSGSVLNAYNSTDLPIALLTIDSIFLGATFIMISVLISTEGLTNHPSYTRPRIKRLAIISGAVSIFLITNISSYFTFGWLKIIAVYYQIWSLPAFLLLFYDVLWHEILTEVEN